MDKTIKTLGQNRLGGYAVIWGDKDALDLDGEWFDSETSELDRIFQKTGVLPMLYDHAMDSRVKTEVIGLVDTLQADDIGLWYEVQLDRANQYAAVVHQLAGESKVGTSSGTLSGGREVEKSGRIARWPIVEISATPTPADPRQITERPINHMKSIYKSIGLELDISAEADKAEEAEADRTSAPTVAEEAKRKLQLQIDILELSNGF